MQSQEILAALKTKKLNFSLVAEAIKVTPQYVSRIAARKETSYRIADALAKSIDQEITAVFPDVEAYQKPQQSRKKVRAEKLAKLRQVIAA